jgi:hypothetical protein
VASPLPCGARFELMQAYLASALLVHRTSRVSRPHSLPVYSLGALGGTRTPDTLVRSQVLYPLSYERPGRSSDQLKFYSTKRRA